MGLLRKSSMPEPRQASRSALVALAVMAMMRGWGTWRRRISAVAWRPSMTGICTSISTTSKLPERTASTASRPLATTVTS